MKTRTIGAILLALCIVLAGAGLLLARGSQGTAAAPAAGSTARVTRGSIEETVSGTGSVAANNQATLTFASSGRTVEVLVEAAQRVEGGQILARLDSSALGRQVARAEAGLATAQARLAQTQCPATAAELASAQAGLDSAKASLARLLAGASEQDLENARLNVDQARDQLLSARASLDGAEANMARLLAGPGEQDLQVAKLSVDSAKNQLWGIQAQRDAIVGSSRQSDAAKDQAEAQVLSAEVAVDQALVALEKLKQPPTEEDLAVAQSQIDSARAQVLASQAGVEQALVAQERLEQPPTVEDLAIAQSQVDQAEAQLAQLRDRPRAEDVALARAQLQEAELSLKQARSQLDDALITAPFGGTILSVLVNPGEWAAPGAPAIVLADMDALILDVNLDEIDIAQLEPGQMARLSFEALPKQEVVGMINRIAPSATNVGGAVAYGVEISFAPGDLPVRLGMTTNVEVVTDRDENALLVPNPAITSDRAAGRYYVSRESSSGITEKVEVKIGMRDDQHTQIVSGLSEGDLVVLAQLPEASADQVAPGMFPGMGAMREMGDER